MSTSPELRQLLARQLDWGEAHVGFERALADFPARQLGAMPAGFAHSCWQLMEHMRRAQADILDFCVNPEYVYPTSLDEYWPDVAPVGEESWERTVASFLEDIESLKRVALDDAIDLFDRVPGARSDRQTYARELILVTDHNAYHLGQLVAQRRALGVWEES